MEGISRAKKEGGKIFHEGQYRKKPRNLRELRKCYPFKELIKMTSLLVNKVK